ncbi:hypothetical protein ABPG74_011127 [Tetrahymena malaccensis]
MFDDQCFILKNYLQQRNQGNNQISNHVDITFEGSVENDVQIYQLLQCFEFGNSYNNGVVDIFNEQDEQLDTQITTNELLTGKSLKSLRLNLTRVFLNCDNMKELSRFTKLCPNLIFLDINLNENKYLNMKHVCDLFANLTELKYLQQLTFEMRFTALSEKSILEITKDLLNIPNLILLSLFIDLSDLTIEGWKGFYQSLRNLKHLNTLIVKNSGRIKTDIPLQLVAKRNYKKIIKLVSKNIISNRLERKLDDEFIGGLFA